MSGTQKIVSKAEQSCQEGNFYEAQQMFKSLFFRYTSQKKYDLSNELINSGVETLVKFDQEVLATELSLLLVELYEKSGQSIDDKAVENAEKIAKSFGRFSEGKTKFLETVVHWVDGKEKQQSQSSYSMHLHKTLALTYWQGQKNYARSQKHFLRCSETHLNAEMLAEWSTQGLDSEKDLFITRAVLQCLCLGKVTEAQAVYYHYLDQVDPLRKLETPLIHFTQLLLVAAEQKNYDMFCILQREYEPSTSRDPSFETLLDSIAKSVFGIRSGGGMFDLLKGLLGTE